MDLATAIRTVGTPCGVPGQSSPGLVSRLGLVKDYVAPSKAPTPAVGLDSWVTLRPIEALHQLAFLTRPSYTDEVYELYYHWALLRYLGFFEVRLSPGGPMLALSPAGRDISGNQRRLTSEEMGIAFGAILAQRWIEADGSGGTSVSVFDIDVVLRHRFVLAGGSQHSVQQVTTQRPDYLLVITDLSTAGGFRVRALECKGTRDRNYALRQLAGALRQLEGVTVGGRTPVGLATSTITADDAVAYLALDPESDDEPSFPVGMARDAPTTFVLGDDTEVPPAVALNATWAVLADWGSNTEALNRWATPALRERPRQSRSRHSLDTPFGPARGERVSLQFAGRTVTAWYGIADSVDQPLMFGPPEAIAEAQAQFADSRQDRAEQLRPDSGAVFSARPDGSIFAVILD